MPTDIDLSYETEYLFSLTDGMTHERIFDALRLGEKLESPLIRINLHKPRWEVKGSDDSFIGPVYVQIDGIHARHRGNRNWFLFGRFRNDKMRSSANPLPTEGAWSSAFFVGSIVCDYTGIFPSHMGVLKTAKQSFFMSPLASTERRLGM